MSVTTKTREVKVGDKVRVLYVPSISSSKQEELTGKIVEVTEVANTRHYARNPETGTEEIQNDGIFCYAMFDTNNGLQTYYFTEWEFVDEPETPENPEIVSLRDQLAASQEQLQTARDARDKLLMEIDKMFDAIIEAANDAGYCGEYDEVVEDVNRMLEARNVSLRMPERQKEFEFRIRWQATVSGYTTVTINATTEERALQELRENDYDYIEDVQLVRDEIDASGVDGFDWEVRP